MRLKARKRSIWLGRCVRFPATVQDRIAVCVAQVTRQKKNDAGNSRKTLSMTNDSAREILALL